MVQTSVSGSGEHPDALQPWQLFTLAGLIGATIVVFMSRGQTPAGIILLSLIIFAAAFVGLAALRTFLPLAGILTDIGPELLGGRTRAALEREKTLVLRSIKELEFDRGMGKVSERDFAEMSARLRARAARLMRQLDAGSLYRQQIEREVEQRLVDRRLGIGDRGLGTGDSGLGTGDSGLGTGDSGAGTRESGLGIRDTAGFGSGKSGLGTDPESPIPDPRSPIPVPGSSTNPCPSCATTNDPDARFCKSCGTRLEQRA